MFEQCKYDPAGKRQRASCYTGSETKTAAAWVSIIAIAYATLTHAGFVYAIYFKLSPMLMGQR